MRLKLSVNGKVNKDLTMKQLKKILFRSVLKMHQLATLYVPVDKGLLKNSIGFFPQYFGATKYILFAGKDYAIYPEFGTINMSAQPYFRPAFDQVKNIWVKRYFKQELGKQKV